MILATVGSESEPEGRGPQGLQGSWEAGVLRPGLGGLRGSLDFTASGWG